jgi:hypothetical protein
MSTTAINAGLTAASAANNAMAQQAAHRARVDRCVVFESRFEVAQASVAEKQEYASCVETLYPMPTTESETVLIKGCIAILLIAMIVGVVYGWRDGRDFESSMLCGLMFPIFATVAIFVIGLVVYGAAYLFS